jgi:cobalt-zinc-cadmium efflux system membrane fusion protein
MNAEVQTRENFVPSLPDDAIISFENQTYIFVDQGNRNFKMVPVIIGSNENGFTEILNAEQLKNEKIVFKGAYTLLMSLKNTGDE